MDPSEPRDEGTPMSEPMGAPPPPQGQVPPPGQMPPPPGQMPPPGQTPPPPQQSWQSSPQQPAPPPPPGSAQPSGMPSWTSNITAQGTIVGPGGAALADIPNRLIAAVIDFIILGIIGYIVGTLTTSILGDELLGGIFGSIKVPSLISSIAAVVIMLAISAAYFIGMWLQMGGQTVGMKVIKLAVRDGATGGPITQQQAINRWLLLGAPFAASFLYAWNVIGWLVWLGVVAWMIYLLVTMAQSPTRQGFHDKYASTVVAKLA